MWPEFAAEGKGSATVRHALCHRAGVPAIRRPLTDEDLWDFATMTDALAATEPWWEPGTRHAYHTNTYGHLIGGLVHRATGELPGTRLRTVADRLDADIFFGVPDAEQHRCAEVLWALGGGPPVVDVDALSGDELMVQLSYFNPPGYSSVGVVNTRAWRSTQIPSTNSHATAAGVARVYQGLLEPGLLLSPSLLAEATSPQSVGFCPVLGEEVAFGLGFTPTTPAAAVRPQPLQLRPLRDRGCRGVRRPRGRSRLRVRHEPRDPPVAEQPEPGPDRRPLPLPLTRRRPAGRAAGHR